MVFLEMEIQELWGRFSFGEPEGWKAEVFLSQ